MNKRKQLSLEYGLVLLISVLVTLIFVYQQWRSHVLLIFNDTIFHYQRFWDLARQFQTGHWSYFQTNFTFSQSGRVINAVYGPVFAALNALLLIACRTWLRYQLISDFIINIVAGIGFYRLAKKVSHSWWAALAMLPLFLSIGSLPQWAAGNTFLAWDAALMPYIMLQGVKMAADTDRPLNWLTLGLTMALAAQIHMLTVVLGALALIPLYVVGLVKSRQKRQQVLNLLKAIGLCLLLTANIWGALLVLRKTPTSLPAVGDLSVNTVMLNHVDNLRFKLLFITLTFILLQTVAALLINRSDWLNFTVTVEGSCLLLFCSRLMPWHHLQELFPILGSALQAPARLTTVAYSLLLAGGAATFAFLFKQASRQPLAWAAAALLLVTSGCALYTTRRSFNLWIAQAQNPKAVVQYNWYVYLAQDRRKLQIAGAQDDPGQFFNYIANFEPDYLPQYNKQCQIQPDYVNHVMRQAAHYQHHVLADGSLRLTWQAKKAHRQTLPVVLYQQSQLKLNGQAVQVRHNNIGNPLVKARKGKNTATLRFETPTGFTACLWLTGLSWLAVLVLAIKKRVQK